MRKKVLEVQDLKVSFHTYSGEVQAVRGVSFDLFEEETIAIVGESGSGKSVTAKSLMKLIHDPGEIKPSSKVFINDANILEYNTKKLNEFRGTIVSMIFQDALASLNPTKRVGYQVAQSLKLHTDLSNTEINTRVLEMMNQVNIPAPERRIRQYPHEFSGGMRQRVMIAMALINNPKILIADEPTTALDVTVQAQILKLIKKMQVQNKMSVIMITHDLGVVAGMAERVLVMYGGMIVESGTTRDIFYNPKHPYTWALLNSVPKLNSDKSEELYSIKGSPPDLLSPPAGCPFAPRCEHRMGICNRLMPPKYSSEDQHTVSCWLMNDKAPKVDLFKRIEVGYNG